MDPSGDAWSVLGSSMSLPSTLSNEIAKLKLALRDVVLAHATSVATLTNEIAELRGELAGIGKIMQNDDSEDFNGFAYVSPEELGIVTEIVKPDMSDVRHVKGFIAPVPEEHPIEEEFAAINKVAELVDEEHPNLLKEEDPTEVVINWWDGMDEEGISYELANLVVEHVAKNGGVQNNQFWNVVYPKGLEVTKGMKSNVKNILAELDNISFVKLDRLRGLYYNSKEDPADVYKRLTGKDLDS